MSRRRRIVGLGDPVPRPRPLRHVGHEADGDGRLQPAPPSRKPEQAPDWPVREPLRLVAACAAAGTVSQLLDRMRASAFQGRRLR
jgi:hypothetical protein